MSKYAEYIKERQGMETVEDHRGFATYEYTKDNAVYIESIYIRPEFRGYNLAAALADEIAERAKAKGCKKMLGSVCPSANGSTASLQVLLAYGFRLSSSANNFILLEKDI